MRRSSLVALLVAGAMLVPLAVFASHQFNDVPNSHTFHNAIDWMKVNNITVGCNPPANTNYCPDDNVTRGQMAAFMKRLAENNVVDAATLDGLDGVAYTNPGAGAVGDNTAIPVFSATPLTNLSINAPAAGGLTISANVTSNALATGAASLWLQVDNTTCQFAVAPFFSVDWAIFEQSGGRGSSATAVGVAAVAAGPHTVTFCAWAFSGAVSALDSSVTAQYVTSVTRTGTLTSASADNVEGVPTD